MSSSQSRLRAALASASIAFLLVVAPSTSASAAAVEPADLPNIVAETMPTLSGETTVGSTLTVVPGTWNVEDVTLTYEWSFGDGCCSGGPLDTTGPSHVITAADSYFGFVGVTITASKEGYASGRATVGTDRIIPNLPPAPVATVAGLTADNRGALTVTTDGSEATITIPGTGPGIGFFVYGYSAPTSLGFFVTVWPDSDEFQPSYDIVVDYSELGGGAQHLAVLDSAGAMVGWVVVDDEALPPPVAGGDDLVDRNDGGATSQPTSVPNEVVIDLPNASPGDSVHVTGYSTPTALGWYVVDDNRQIRINFSGLAPGAHKIAISAADGTLLGWVPVTVASGALADTGAAASPTLFGASLALLALGIAVALGNRGRRLVA